MKYKMKLMLLFHAFVHFVYVNFMDSVFFVLPTGRVGVWRIQNEIYYAFFGVIEVNIPFIHCLIL